LLNLISYIKNGKRIKKNDELIFDAFLLMQDSNDRLSNNYKFNNLKLDRMYHYNFIFNCNQPVLASGCEIVSHNVVRVMSRYYVFPNYRTDGTNLLEKTDDFYELQYVLKNLEDFKLIIWSRDQGSYFFKRLKKGRPDIFSDWKIYPQKIELKYKDNFQSIFYVGDITYLSEVIYDRN